MARLLRLPESFSIRLPPGFRGRLEAARFASERDVADVARAMLEDGLEQRESGAAHADRLLNSKEPDQ